MRRLCYAILILLILASCRDKVICPAFQSTYILDDSVRTTYFSYSWYVDEGEGQSNSTANASIPPPDSLGVTVASTEQGAGVDYYTYTANYKVPPRTTRKTKNGIVKRTPLIPNIVRNFQLKSTPMENVLTPPEVKKEEVQDEIPSDSTSYAPLDSTATVAQVDSLNVSQPTDSLAVAETKEEKAKKEWERFKYGFNPMDSLQPDQEYYFRKYGYLLQNKPPPEEKESVQSDQTALPDSLQTEKKGLKGLFKKKGKTKTKKKSKEDEPEESGNTEATEPEEEVPSEEPAEEDTEGGN